MRKTGLGKEVIMTYAHDTLSSTETGTCFLVPVFGTGFWIVCHGPNNIIIISPFMMIMVVVVMQKYCRKVQIGAITSDGHEPSV